MTRGLRSEIKVSRPSNHIQTDGDGLYNSLIVSVVVTNTLLILIYVHTEIITVWFKSFKEKFYSSEAFKIMYSRMR